MVEEKNQEAIVGETKHNDVVIPGDELITPILAKASEKSKIILGPGLRREGDKVFVMTPGILRYQNRPKGTYWVDCIRKRYNPVNNEDVIGIVTKKIGDYYKVDINGPESALLHCIQGFENATKKNRPELNVGDAVYARVIVTSSDMEPEIQCLSSQGKKELYQILPVDGFLIRTSLHLVRKLRDPKSQISKHLGQVLKFEKIIGMNGFIWIKADDVSKTIEIAKVLLSAENISSDKLQLMCENLIKI